MTIIFGLRLLWVFGSSPSHSHETGRQAGWHHLSLTTPAYLTHPLFPQFRSPPFFLMYGFWTAAAAAAAKQQAVNEEEEMTANICLMGRRNSESRRQQMSGRRLEEWITRQEEIGRERDADRCIDG